MKLSRFTVIALVASAAFVASGAIALSEDDKSMNTPGGAARFTDPDEQMPGQAVYLQDGKAASGAVDPSSVRYDYDPTSGSFVPHKN